MRSARFSGILREKRCSKRRASSPEKLKDYTRATDGTSLVQQVKDQDFKEVKKLPHPSPEAGAGLAWQPGILTGKHGSVLPAWAGEGLSR